MYNLSELTRDEAEALIVEKEGKLCVRYFQRADGTILLKDCAVGVRQRRRRRWMAVGVAASLAGAVFGYTRTRQPAFVMGAVAVRPTEPQVVEHPHFAQPPEEQVVMGRIAIPRPDPDKQLHGTKPSTVNPHR